MLRGGTLEDAQTPAYATALTPLLLGARRVAVSSLAAERAREWCVVGTAEDAAAQLLHARDGFDVALLGSPPDVVAGEAHVDAADEDVAEHLAELVLGLQEALQGSLSYPPHSVLLHHPGGTSLVHDRRKVGAYL